MKRFIVGAIAAAALLVAVPAWAAIGEPVDMPFVDIVAENPDTGETSTGGYSIDAETGAKRAFVQMALAGPSSPRAIYVVLLYDSDGDRLPIAGQIMTGDGTSTALRFAGRDVDGDGEGDGINVNRSEDVKGPNPDDAIYACATTFYRGKLRDLAGYNERGQCTTVAGAMELPDGLSPGGSGFE